MRWRFGSTHGTRSISLGCLQLPHIRPCGEIASVGCVQTRRRRCGRGCAGVATSGFDDCCQLRGCSSIVHCFSRRQGARSACSGRGCGVGRRALALVQPLLILLLAPRGHAADDNLTTFNGTCSWRSSRDGRDLLISITRSLLCAWLRTQPRARSTACSTAASSGRMNLGDGHGCSRSISTGCGMHCCSRRCGSGICFLLL